MTLYLDISHFLKTRLSTGIQRVVVEFLARVINDTYKVHIIHFDTDSNRYKALLNDEVKLFLQDIRNYRFKNSLDIELFTPSNENRIFFDIDVVWNSEPKRETLYKKLKSYNFKIHNIIYDLIPIIHPEFFYMQTKENFPNFLYSVYKQSDFIFFISNSTQNDFYKTQKTTNINRKIPSKVLLLGSDFSSKSSNIQTKYSDLLTKKYILFVGTIEPRKQQDLALKAFENVYKYHNDLHLVFIGKVGWKVDDFIDRINTHPLKDKNLHHLTDVNDATLTQFYKNAFLVSYFSKYEGYGLPIAESLFYHNITITLKNSSIYEVGGKNADYLTTNLAQNLEQLILFYLENKTSYKNRKQYIKSHYKNNSWDTFYNLLTKTCL